MATGEPTPEELLLGAILGVEYTPRIGARDLDAATRRAIAAARRDEAPIRRVRSADSEASAYFRALIEGAALRSTTDPDRANRVQTSSDPSLGGREHDAIERHATTARALERASWREDALVAICSAVPARHARWVYALVVVGKPIRKGGWIDWRSRSPEQIASEDLDARVSVGQVLDLAGYFRDAVRDALYASGELGAIERAPRAAREHAADRGLGRIDWSLME